MASSAQQGFVDPYSFTYQPDNVGYDFNGLGRGGFLDRIGQLMGIDRETKYQESLTRQDQEYERQSIQSARAWSEYMDNTQFQRRVADLKAAGLNPWLAVQNGISGSGAPTVDTGGSAKHQTKSEQAKTLLGMLLLTVAKIVG